MNPIAVEKFAWNEWSTKPRTRKSKRALGGKGSGNFGRPGEVGGSSSKDSNVVGVNSKAFKAWFKNSKVVDEDGKPLVVYHGSTHDIESFLPAGHEKLNIESDWGRGIYFTNNQEDVSDNYAGEGPDLTSRIEQRAEEIAGTMEHSLSPNLTGEYEEGEPLSYDDMIEKAREQARAELVGKSGAVAVPVYLSIQNPFIVGDDLSGEKIKDNWLDAEFEYAPLSDFQDDEIADMRERHPDYSDDDIRRELSDNNGYEPTQKGKLFDFIDALKTTASRFDDTDGVYEFVDKLADYSYEGISSTQLDKLWRQHEVYATDDVGRIAKAEIFRLALEKAGFDGVIDRSVYNKFGYKSGGRGMAGVYADTTHYVAFKPTQVKSAIGNRGTYDRDNPLITLAEYVPETLVHEAADAFVSKYADAVQHAFNVGLSAVDRFALRQAKTLDDALQAVNPAIRATRLTLGSVLPLVIADVVRAGGFAGVELLKRDRIKSHGEIRQAGGPGSGNFGHQGRPGEVGGSKAKGSDAGTGSDGRKPVQTRSAPNVDVQRIANDYARSRGFGQIDHSAYLTVNEQISGTIADAYDALPVDDSANPKVREAYEALAEETDAQYAYAVSRGVQFIPWTKEGQPYQSSAEMAEDVRTNNRLYFFTGGNPHPFLSSVDEVTGLTRNDKFRAIHDYFGHAAGGYGFGARGEENAWNTHSQMFSIRARRAMTTETRGQNSWVNFGRHNYDAEGNYKNIPPGERPFAEQKVALLPDHFVFRAAGEKRALIDGDPNKRTKKSGIFTMEFDYTNPDVLAWAEQHAAELIAGIDKTTRKRIRQHVVDALDSGNLDDLERQLIPLLGDRERAELIAHTETMAAANEGQRQSWQQAIEDGYLEAGLIREWIATADEVTCPICRELNGQRTKLDGWYPNGGADGPPAHPRCRCTEGIVG